MKNHFTLLKTAKPTSWRRWIIAVATVLMLNVSLSFTGQAQQNYLPPGCEASKGGDVVYYDMYFDADVGRALSTNEIRYINIGKDFPDLQVGEIIINGDYKKGFVPYKIKSIEQQKDEVVLTVDKVNPIELMPDNVKATIDPAKEVPNFASIQDDKGVIQNYTTDKRYYEKHSTKSGNENLHFVSGKSTLAAGIEVTKAGFTVFDSFTTRQKSEGTYVKTAGGYEKVDASSVTYNLAIKLMINEIYVKSNTTIDYEWTKNSWGKLEHFSILKKGTSELKLDATIDFDFIGSYDLGKTKLGFVYFTFPVPASQILISATLIPYFDHGSIAGQIGGTIRAGGQTTCTSEYGIEYNKATGFSPLGSPVPDVTFGLYNGDPESVNNLPSINITGEVNWKPGLRVRTQIKLLSVIQITLDPKSYLKFDFKGELGTSSLNYDYGLSWCPLQVDAKIDYFNLFKRNWAGVWSQHIYTMPDVLIYQKKVGHTFSGNLSGPGDDNTDDAYLAADGTTVVENTNPPGEIGISAFVSVNDYNLDLDYQGTVLMDENEGLNLEADIVKLNFTDDLRPVFTFTAVPNAKKYQLKIGDLVYETLETVFQPEENMPPQVEADITVTAYNDYGRAGKASPPKQMNIGLTIDGGNSFHGILNYGNQVTVYDPGTKKTYDFYFYDYENNSDPTPDELLIKIKDHSTGALVKEIIIYAGAPVRIDGLGLFIYSIDLFVGTSGSVFTEIMITPYFLPSVKIESPAGEITPDCYVNLFLDYCGKNVPSTGVDPLSASQLRTLTYNSVVAGDNGDYFWNMNGEAGERTMTVVLTDMFGNHINDDVTVEFDPIELTYSYAQNLSISVWKNKPDGRWDVWTRNSADYSGGSFGISDNYGHIDKGVTSRIAVLSNKFYSAIGRIVSYMNGADGASTPNTIQVMVVTPDMYNNGIVSNSCDDYVITYKEVCNELAKRLGKDSKGRYRVWVSESVENCDPSNAIFVDPTVTTTGTVSTIGSTTAQSGGNVTYDGGGGYVSARGVCWSTTSSPTTADSKTIDGTGTGCFTSSLRGLIPGRLHYVRAYATNSAGTSYGAQVPFITTVEEAGNYVNRDFESSGGWTITGSGGSVQPVISIAATDGPNSGNRYAKITNTLGSVGTKRTGYITQSVTLPSNAKTISYYVKWYQGTYIGSLGVRLRNNSGTVLAGHGFQIYSNHSGSGWIYKSFDVSAYVGQEIKFEIYLTDTERRRAGLGHHNGYIGVDDITINCSSPVAQYYMDENYGSIAYDATENDNDGTIYGATWTDGKIGSALSFDGVDDYVKKDSPNNLPLGNSPRTMSAWIKPVSYPNSNYNGIVVYGTPATNQGCLLSIDNDGRLSQAFWGNDLHQTTGSPATLNEWNFVAFTWDGTTRKLYLNGVEVTSGTASNVNTTNYPIRIGCTDIPGRYFKGEIDEVTIYDRALTADEIAEHAGGGKGTANTDEEETVTGIPQVEETGRLLVYPNPMSNELSIVYDVQSAGIVTIDIYDITGRMVQTLTNAYTLPGEHTVQWNANDTKGTEMPNGTYFIRMQTENNAQTTKVILMR